MKLITQLSILALSLLVLACSSEASENGSSEDFDGIRNCYESYKEAALAADGESAAEFVDENTINYYHNILDDVLYADSTEVVEMNLVDKMMVLIIRHKISPEMLTSLTGKELFIHAIDLGLVGNEGIKSQSLGEITVEGEKAKGKMIVNGTESPFFMEFTKEDGKWRNNLTSLFDIIDSSFKHIIDESGMGEDEYLIFILQMMDGTAPSPAIWHPIDV